MGTALSDTSMMMSGAGGNLLSNPLGAVFFLVLSMFYVFRIARCQANIGNYTWENEAAHSLMSLGMASMLLPTLWSPPLQMVWTVIFLVLTGWFLLRLLLRHALSSSAIRLHNLIYVLMSLGMAYVSAMRWVQGEVANQLAILVFTTIGVTYLWWVYADLRREYMAVPNPLAAKRLEVGVDLAHAAMCVGMLSMLL